MSDTVDRRAASTIGELDLHISYIQQSLRDVLHKVEDMATKQDIKELEARMSQFVTKEELTHLEERLRADSVTSKFDTWLSWITKIGGAGAVIAAAIGGIAAAVHFIEHVQK